MVVMFRSKFTWHAPQYLFHKCSHSKLAENPIWADPEPDVHTICAFAQRRCLMIWIDKMRSALSIYLICTLHCKWQCVYLYWEVSCLCSIQFWYDLVE